ncbi:NUDIX domain-containing protein, partial [bacterium]|nr:NUDIX domain-containing protein [bacterium]
DMLFVVKMTDKVKKDDYYRPVGGSVEFGEFAINAVQREVSEELNTEIEITGAPLILENLFTCDGEAGHEIDYFYPCKFVDERFYERKNFELIEADGSHWQAIWVKRSDCLDGTLRLVPDSLLDWNKAQ